jgi:hypothetical protein
MGDSETLVWLDCDERDESRADLGLELLLGVLGGAMGRESWRILRSNGLSTVDTAVEEILISGAENGTAVRMSVTMWIRGSSIIPVWVGL